MRTRPACRPRRRPLRQRRSLVRFGRGSGHTSAVSPCLFRRPGYVPRRMNPRLLALLALTAAAGGAAGQPDPTAGRATTGDLPPAIVKTLEALGASSGVPDG